MPFTATELRWLHCCFLADRKLFVSLKGLRFGHFRVCKTVYPGSIPGVASTHKIKDLVDFSEARNRGQFLAWEHAGNMFAPTAPPSTKEPRHPLGGSGASLREDAPIGRSQPILDDDEGLTAGCARPGPPCTLRRRFEQPVRIVGNGPRRALAGRRPSHGLRQTLRELLNWSPAMRSSSVDLALSGWFRLKA